MMKYHSYLAKNTTIIGLATPIYSHIREVNLSICLITFTEWAG